MALPFHPRPDKLSHILDKLCEHRPWFADHVWADPGIRREAATSYLAETYTNGYLFEVYRGDQLVGILQLTNLVPQVEVTCHFVFFDRTLSDKLELCLDVMRWAYETLALHILRVEIPTHVRPLLKFARRLGFRYESENREPSWPKLTDDWAGYSPLDEKLATIGSRKHHTMKYQGEWVDSLMLSITREEYEHGWRQNQAREHQHSASTGSDEPAGAAAQGLPPEPRADGGHGAEQRPPAANR